MSIRYGYDDRPRFPLAIVLGFQHMFASFNGIIVVPVIVLGSLGLNPAARAYCINSAIFIAGAATLLQSAGLWRIGSRMPCVMGTDFTFVGPSIAVGQAYGIAAVYTATFLGGFSEIVFSRFSRILKRIFPPIVSGTVIILIGLTLIPVAANWLAGGSGSEDYASAFNLITGIAVAVLIVLLNRCFKGFVSSSSILIGIIAGFVFYLALGRVDTSSVSAAGWVMLPSPFRFGFDFRPGALLPFLVAYLVTTIETIGDLNAIAGVSGRELSEKQLSGGILADGVGSVLGGMFNAGANTSFSQNIGIIPVTRVASRYVVMICGIILMLLGVFPRLGAIIDLVPLPVLGGAGIVMFTMIIVGGIKTVRKVHPGPRDITIVAVSLALGMLVVIRPQLLGGMPELMKIFFESGITTGSLAAVILNFALPGKT